MRSLLASDVPDGVSCGDAAELAQAGRHVLVEGLLDGLGAPARSALVVQVLEGWSAPERVQVAAAALAGLSSAAQLDAIVRALADMGADGALDAVRRAGAERLLAGAEPAVAEQAVDRLAWRLAAPARARLAERLLTGLTYDVRDQIFHRCDVQMPADDGETDTSAAAEPCVAAGEASLDGGTDAQPMTEGTSGALALADRLIDGVATETLSGAVSDGQLQSSVDALVVLGRKVDAERLRRLEEIEERGSHGARSTADMMRERYGIASGTARRELQTARRLRRLPGTRRKLAAGQLDRSHAEQAARALTEIHAATAAGRLTDEQAAQATETVDRITGDVKPGEDAQTLRRRLEDANVERGTIDLDERQRRAFEHRRLWIGTSTQPGEEGMIAIQGALDPVAGERLRAHLERRARRHGPLDQRTKLQRMADALTSLEGHAASRPPRDDRPPHPANANASAPQPCETATAEHAAEADAGHAGASSTPRTARPAQVVLITSSAALNGLAGAEPSWLDGHGPVGSETARQICCDAEITLVTLDDAGQPLNVGRRHRDPNEGQRTAAIARDRTCVGCGAPARSCQLHHIKFWHRDKGRTDIDNLCLLCQSCHTKVHHFGWIIERAGTATFRARPPTRGQPTQ